MCGFEVDLMVIGLLMANLIELGVACGGSSLGYDIGDGILQVLVFVLKSHLNSESSLLICRIGDLWRTVRPLRRAVRLQKARHGCFYRTAKFQ